MKLSQFDPSTVTSLLAELQAEATSFVRSCDSEAEINAEFKAYMRYTGQGWEIPVSLSAEQAAHPDAAQFQQLFEKDYETLFGRTVDGMDIEITVWAANATTPAQPVTPVEPAVPAGLAPSSACREVFDAAIGEAVSASVVLRRQMQAGQCVTGPSIITEDETTIIVPVSRQAICQPDGCIDMIRVGMDFPEKLRVDKTGVDKAMLDNTRVDKTGRMQ
jgi:N-methylhydantoinase A